MNNIKNLSVWVCTGEKDECLDFRAKLSHHTITKNKTKTDSDDHEINTDIDAYNGSGSGSGVIQIPLNLQNVLMPFMNSLSNGSQNCNLFFNVFSDHDVDNEENNNNNNDNELELRFLPLDALPIQNQINTKRLAFKVLSCGTFKRNLQPMPDACRITKLTDGQDCYACIDDALDIGIRINTKKVFDRKKQQGADSVLGAGFDCSSKCSWRKPRVYWVSKSTGYVRDPLRCPNKLQKRVVSNMDVRISLLWPRHMTGRVDFYLGGIISPYIEKINVDTYEPAVGHELDSLNNDNNLDNDNCNNWEIVAKNAPDNNDDILSAIQSNITNTFNNMNNMNDFNGINTNSMSFNGLFRQIPPPPTTLQFNPITNNSINIPNPQFVYQSQPQSHRYPQPPNPNNMHMIQIPPVINNNISNNTNHFHLFATPPVPNVANFESNSSTNSGTTNTTHNCNNSPGNGQQQQQSSPVSLSSNTASTATTTTSSTGPLGASATNVDAHSLSILNCVEKDLIMGTLNHSTSINKLNVQAPYVLDALSQLLIFCIKHQNGNNRYQNSNNPVHVHVIDVHCNYYVAILNHIGKSLGEQCAVDGFIKCWIDMDTDTENTVHVRSNNNNSNNAENLCSFMHLVTRYNRVNLMQHTLTLFSAFYKNLVNAFVDIRTTLYNESSLVIGIKYGYEDMIEYMLSGIWRANGINSPIVMNNIINSAFDNCGTTVLAALIQFKLFLVLGYLINNNVKARTQFLSQRDILMIEQNININQNTQQIGNIHTINNMNIMNNMNPNAMNNMNAMNMMQIQPPIMNNINTKLIMQ